MPVSSPAGGVTTMVAGQTSRTFFAGQGVVPTELLVVNESNPCLPYSPFIRPPVLLDNGLTRCLMLCRTESSSSAVLASSGRRLESQNPDDSCFPGSAVARVDRV